MQCFLACYSFYLAKLLNKRNIASYLGYDDAYVIALYYENVCEKHWRIYVNVTLLCITHVYILDFGIEFYLNHKQHSTPENHCCNLLIPHKL